MIGRKVKCSKNTDSNAGAFVPATVVSEPFVLDNTQVCVFVTLDNEPNRYFSMRTVKWLINDE